MSPRRPAPAVPAAPVPVGTPRPLRFGYGTNGLADLRLDDALTLLADLGYDGVGLTLDHMHLDPLAPHLAARTRRLARRLDALALDVTVETGGRYVLDPRRKHGPSLLDADPDERARRVDLLIRAVRIAGDLGAHAVHCFSGTLPPGTDRETAWRRLADALAPVLAAAVTAGVPLAVEPEPGHLLASLADFHHLRLLLGDPEPLGLTLDIGHCQCLEPLPPADCVRAAAPWLRHVQIEDMRRGVHEHLPFGDGEIDFPPVLAALRATGYQGLTVVELPRHSHAGPRQAELSLPFLHHAATPAPFLHHAATPAPPDGHPPALVEPAPGPPAPGAAGHRPPMPGAAGHRQPAPEGFGDGTLAPGEVGHRAPAPGGPGYRPSAPGEVGHRPPAPEESGDGRLAPVGAGHRPSAPGGPGYRPSAAGEVGHRAPARGEVGHRAPARGEVGHRAPARGEVGHRAPAPGKPGHHPPTPEQPAHGTPAPEQPGHRLESQEPRPTHRPPLPPPALSPVPPGEPCVTQEGSTS